jgi:uncharacterized protein
MRDFRDAKAMAQTLREVLAARSVSLTHSESLELVARILGFRDWNVLSARIQSQPAGTLATSISASPGLPIAPLRDIVFFPQMISPIFIGREKTKRAVEHAMASDSRILAITQRHSSDDTPGADALYSVGVIAEVIYMRLLEDGTAHAIVKGLERATIVHFVDGEFLSAEITPIEDRRGFDPEASKLKQTVLGKLETYLNINFSQPQPPYARLPRIHEPGTFADAVAPFLPIRIDERQDLLETSDVVTRLEKILAVVTKDRQAA